VSAKLRGPDGHGQVSPDSISGRGPAQFQRGFGFAAARNSQGVPNFSGTRTVADEAGFAGRALCPARTALGAIPRFPGIPRGLTGLASAAIWKARVESGVAIAAITQGQAPQYPCRVARVATRRFGKRKAGSLPFRKRTYGWGHCADMVGMGLRQHGKCVPCLFTQFPSVQRRPNERSEGKPQNFADVLGRNIEPSTSPWVSPKVGCHSTGARAHRGGRTTLDTTVRMLTLGDVRPPVDPCHF
jgi:hypothetical protein